MVEKCQVEDDRGTVDQGKLGVVNHVLQNIFSCLESFWLNHPGLVAEKKIRKSEKRGTCVNKCNLATLVKVSRFDAIAPPVKSLLVGEMSILLKSPIHLHNSQIHCWCS